MIVASVMDAISGKKIQKAPAILGVQFNARATPVADVHLQCVEKPHPLRIYIFLILQVGECRIFLNERDLAYGCHY